MTKGIFRLALFLLLVQAGLCFAQVPTKDQQEEAVRPLADSLQRAPAERPASLPRPVATPFRGIARQDTVAMLIVLVRFQDDDWGACARWWCHLEDWPHLDLFGSGDSIPRARLPHWATTLLERSPDRVREEHLTMADSSISAYYFWQSRTAASRPHIVYGEAWPEVYVAERSNRDYYSLRDSMGTSVRRPSGFGYLTKELLDNLVGKGLDLGRYDHDRNGVVDHIMMIFRRDSLFMGQGWATLSGYYNAAGAPDENGDRRPDSLRYWSPSRRDSVRVDWNYSGSQNFSSDVMRGLFVHEYAHRLMDLGGHLQVIQYEEPRPGQKVLCAYARMCGVPTSYDASSLTFSAHERRRMGWLNVEVVRPAEGDRRGMALRDLYGSGEAIYIPLGPGAAADTMTIVNRQRLGFFDRDRAIPSLNPAFDFVYRGLATRGLQVALSDGDPSARSGFRYGFLPADGSYERVSRCSGSHPDCFGPNTYAGDLFSPEWVDQLTPWTRPNSSGFRRAELIAEGATPQWFAIDGIRYLDGDPDSTMLFDFIADARRKPRFVAEGEPWPVIRVDSWMGPESDGLVFEDEVLVRQGATLYIGADDVLSDSLSGRHASLGAVRVTFERGLTMEIGARLIVGPDAVISIRRGILGGLGSEFVVEPDASIVLGPEVRFYGSTLFGEPDPSILSRFQRRQ